MPDEGLLTREDNEAAAAFVRDKARTNIRIFGDMLPETRAHAFAVAGIEEMRRLKQVQEAIARVPEGGDWKEAREKIAAAIGDPEKNAARAETVLRTNCFQAYAAARYRSQMDPGGDDAFPYLKYVTVGDSRVRDSHARLNGTILRKDDPFWETHYPPWDWGCRCIAVELTEEMARDEQAEGTGTLRDKAWSEDWRAAHNAQDSARDYQFRPGSLSIALDDAAVKGYKEDGTPDLRYDEETLRRFNEKMGKATVELPDGTTKNVREWMWEPVREKAEKRLLDAGSKDGLEHAAVLDRNTGSTIPHTVRKTDEGHVSIEYELKAGQMVDLLHNHPNWDTRLSPQDVISAFDGHIREVGCTTPMGGMRLRVQSKDTRVLERVRRFDEKLKSAATNAERKRIMGEWIAFVKAMKMTGVFEAEGL